MTIENNADLSPIRSPGINRRNLLKGAAAAGVGVVAWSSPSITSIGGTPAYAAVCTGGKQSWFIGAEIPHAAVMQAACPTSSTSSCRAIAVLRTSSRRRLPGFQPLGRRLVRIEP